MVLILDGNHWPKRKIILRLDQWKIFMKKKITTSLISLIVSLVLLVAFFGFTSSIFAANEGGDPIQGLNETAGQIKALEGKTSTTTSYQFFIQDKVGQAIGIILSFVGTAFLLLMIYAGILWMTAQGNEKQVTTAKDLMINAAIGIIIVFAAYAITSFIGNNLVG